LSWLLPPATALVIIVGSVLLLTTPFLMHPALQVATQNTLATPDMAFRFSDPTVHDLLFGGDFNIDLGGGAAFYTPGEVAHLRDARAVLHLFVALAVASLTFVIAALVHRPHDARRWGAVARGGAGLAIGAVVVGVVGFLAFDAAFELFHRVLFPGGNWEFPADSNMIRLYPFEFWQLTAVGLGVLCVIGGGLVWWVARRRAA
jgi:hypothetical protein